MEENKTPSDTEQLTAQIKRLIRSQNFANSFLRGMYWGLGNLIGSTIVIGLILWILSQLPLIPYFGAMVADIVTSAQQQILLRL